MRWHAWWEEGQEWEKCAHMDHGKFLHCLQLQSQSKTVTCLSFLAWTEVTLISHHWQGSDLERVMNMNIRENGGPYVCRSWERFLAGSGLCRSLSYSSDSDGPLCCGDSHHTLHHSAVLLLAITHD